MLTRESRISPQPRLSRTVLLARCACVASLLSLACLAPVQANAAKANIGFSLYAAKGAPGVGVTLRSLVVSGASPVSGLSIDFQVDGTPAGSAISGPTGVALAYTIPALMAQGVHNVTVSFVGNATYNPATRTTAALTVAIQKAGVSLSIFSVTGAAQSSVTLKTLVYSGGTPISGLLVDFQVNGTPAGSATSDATGASVSYFIPEGTPTGTYNVTVSFAGDATHSAVTRTSAALTVKWDVFFSLYLVDGDPGTTVALRTLVYSGDVAISGLPVKFAVDGVTVGTVTSDPTGASFNYAIPPGKANGLYNVTVSFAGNSTHDPATRTTAALRVGLPPADVGFSIAPVTGAAGDTVTLQTLVYGGNAPAAGLTINFAVNGAPVGSAVSDSSGASLSYTIPGIMADGLYNVTVSFAGDATHNPASRTSAALRVGVNPANVALSIFAASGHPGDTVTLKTLVVSAGVPVSGLTIDFSVNGVPVGSAVSDPTGASLSYTIPLALTPGTYNVTVTFAGDATHNSATRTLTALTVN